MKPGSVLMLLGAGHAVWGASAYRDALAEIARAGVIDSVGDGHFNREHSHDGRAAAFWFMSAAPLVGLCGYLANAAERAGDRRAERVTAGVLTAYAAAGLAAIPRSGFVGGLPIALWALRRSRRAG